MRAILALVFLTFVIVNCHAQEGTSNPRKEIEGNTEEKASATGSGPNKEKEKPVWNSLEVVKLFAGVLIPVAVVWFAYSFNKRLKEFELEVNKQLKQFELLQWGNQKVIEKRIKVYEELAPLLNDLLCYYTFIGSWKAFTPPDVVDKKRNADQIAYVNAPLFPPGFIDRYNEFIRLCFAPYPGWPMDAKLRTATERRKQAAGGNWDPKWDEYFNDPTKCEKPEEVKKVYEEFMTYFANALGVGVKSEPVLTGRIPGAIR